jgi:hypothetical protein
MNKISLLMLLCLAVVAGGAFLLWIGNGREGEAAAPPSAGRGGEPRPTAVPLVPPVVAGTLEDEAVGRAAPARPPEGLEGAMRTGLAESDLETLVVQVWDGEEGVPAIDTDVFLLEGLDGLELGDPFAPHWSEQARELGTRSRTDADGRVELPEIEQTAIVTAEKSGAWGFAKLEPRSGRGVETITLTVDETVTVRVLDREGKPSAEVPVGVVQLVPVRRDAKELWAVYQELEAQLARVEDWSRQHPLERERAAPRIEAIRARRAELTVALRAAKQRASKSGERDGTEEPREAEPSFGIRAETRARRRTDAEGYAVFRHFQVYREHGEDWWPLGTLDRFEAVLLMPLQRPEGRVFAGRPVPAETIELQLPPVGSLALRTVDRDGRPFRHPVTARLAAVGADVAPWSRVEVRKEQDRSAIVVPFVGLDLLLTAECRLDDEDFRWRSPELVGPTAPGERATVDLVVAPDAGMLYGRLLDARSQPHVGLRATFLIQCLSGRLEGEEITLDREGRFHLPYLARPEQMPPYRLEIRRDDVQPPLGLAMPLETLPMAFVTDLGDLRLDGLDRIAHGRVVDDRGHPIAGASVQLQRERNVGRDGPRMKFVDEAFVTAHTDEAGRFTLFGALERARYRLHVEARDHFPEDTLDLQRQGGAPFELALVRKARVVGSVRTPDWLSSKRIAVRLESALDPGQHRDDRIHDYQGGKYVYFDWVRPGIYALELRVADLPDPFLRIDGLRLEPGQVGMHPRLRELDLGAFLFRFEILAVDENGRTVAPVEPLLARVVRPDGRAGFVGFPWQDGRAEVIHSRPQLDVRPRARGYRTAPAVTLPQGRSELRFVAIPPVEVAVPGLAERVGAAADDVWIVLTPRGAAPGPDGLETWDDRSRKINAAYRSSRSAYARLGPDDVAEIAVVENGRYRVRGYLVGRGKVAFELGEIVVSVEPGGSPQRVTLSVDPARLQSALAELDG